jgi:hypothetical protein
MHATAQAEEKCTAGCNGSPAVQAACMAGIWLENSNTLRAFHSSGHSFVFSFAKGLLRKDLSGLPGALPMPCSCCEEPCWLPGALL